MAMAPNGKTSWEMKERNIEKNRRSPKNKKQPDLNLRWCQCEQVLGN
jgi:hypothetical protein